MDIRRDLQKAQEAAYAGRFDEAVRLSLQALEEAPQSADREQISWAVPQVASALLANNKQPQQAERLYQRVFTLVESWSADTVRPLLSVAENYCRFLVSQPERSSDVPSALDRYRALLLSAHGEDTGVSSVLAMSIEFNPHRNSSNARMIAAQESLALEESLSGTTSEPYLGAIRRAAAVFDYAGNSARALELRRRAVAIADLVFLPDDVERATIRMEVAHALANQGAFDEAERLADEAVAIGRTTRISRLDYLNGQRTMIRKMRRAGVAAA